MNLSEETIKIYEKLKEQLPNYNLAKLYKFKYDEYMELTMSCNREEAMIQCIDFSEKAKKEWEIFGILAACDLFYYLKKQNK